VTEAVHIVSDLREFSEVIEEETLSNGDLPLGGKTARQVAIRLNVPTSDGIPAAGFDVVADTFEEIGIQPADLLVDPCLAAGVNNLRVTVEKIRDIITRVEDFVEAIAPGPKPDGIEMSV
jgi:hypothetical protein